MLFDAVLILVGALAAFPVGMMLGERREKQWQIEKRRTSRKIRHAQREVSKLSRMLMTPKQVEEADKAEEYLSRFIH